jgi:hypothetical protein
MRSGRTTWIVATLLGAISFITLSQFVGASGSVSGAGSSIASRITWSVGAVSAIAFLVLSARALLAHRSRDRKARLSS